MTEIDDQWIARGLVGATHYELCLVVMDDGYDGYVVTAERVNINSVGTPLRVPGEKKRKVFVSKDRSLAVGVFTSLMGRLQP